MDKQKFKIPKWADRLYNSDKRRYEFKDDEVDLLLSEVGVYSREVRITIGNQIYDVTLADTLNWQKTGQSPVIAATYTRQGKQQRVMLPIIGIADAIVKSSDTAIIEE